MFVIVRIFKERSSKLWLAPGANSDALERQLTKYSKQQLGREWHLTKALFVLHTYHPWLFLAWDPVGKVTFDSRRYLRKSPLLAGRLASSPFLSSHPGYMKWEKGAKKVEKEVEKRELEPDLHVGPRCSWFSTLFVLLIDKGGKNRAKNEKKGEKGGKMVEQRFLVGRLSEGAFIIQYTVLKGKNILREWQELRQTVKEH
ncbi:hypothetical protein C8J57DRAFT_1483121 [Mycena rebaudengoi]|nr:hypothetical protein C8J57DRAFT_1483121 [Mycena rebaudengoi]